MQRAFRAAQDGWALSLNAFAALLISPVSWSHQWVWAVPALLALAGLGWRTRARLPWIAVISGLVVFAAGAEWWFPSGSHRELRWAAWEQIVASSYVIFAAVVVLVFAAVRLANEAAPLTGSAPTAAASVPEVSSLGDLT
jgi:alpha-1,2-mannosyltransferase